MGINLHVPLPGPFTYTARLGGKRKPADLGCIPLAAVGGLVVVVLGFVIDHWIWFAAIGGPLVALMIIGHAVQRREQREVAEAAALEARRAELAEMREIADRTIPLPRVTNPRVVARLLPYEAVTESFPTTPPS